jgi:hypothetical protein
MPVDLDARAYGQSEITAALDSVADRESYPRNPIKADEVHMCSALIRRCVDLAS